MEESYDDSEGLTTYMETVKILDELNYFPQIIDQKFLKGDRPGSLTFRKMWAN